MEIPAAPVKVAAQEVGRDGDAKSQAESRLKEELDQLNAADANAPAEEAIEASSEEVSEEPKVSEEVVEASGSDEVKKDEDLNQ